jgi:hypothetical protein
VPPSYPKGATKVNTNSTCPPTKETHLPLVMCVLETLRKKAKSLEVILLLVMEAQLQIGGMYNTFVFLSYG